MKYKHIVGIIIILSTSSCSTVNTPSNVRVGPTQEINLTIIEDIVIDLNITAGDVVIESSPGDQLRAEMTVECPGINSKCAKRMTGLKFVSLTEGKHLTLKTNKDSLFQSYNANLSVKLFIPKSKQLNVNMDAGSLKVNNVDSCLNIDMSAGEINIHMSETMIASVDLDSAFGEVSLNVNGLHKNENRSWLVGGEINWDQGRGNCHMKVDLQSGEILVNLAG
ncbi:DUF4097 family beta strand repeat protein [Colwellia sp. BRX8-7]|jgi:hypothetical protein|uniref:DUF4097 family beta strand repeat-containing protein n=1 Tax=Colwellia sp. BRX8-7 TaxID=2759833 RepID=UPI0015F668B1|nr:DUF4097 family beta strand repeat-containing protein [Colwellia sp. BRX8-7]MBA6338421.1 DUF4097 family beta strand repeat protein [Colwellia sp. BRX8-7]